MPSRAEGESNGATLVYKSMLAISVHASERHLRHYAVLTVPADARVLGEALLCGNLLYGGREINNRESTVFAGVAYGWSPGTPAYFPPVPLR